ncbi:MAG: hypothetical protein SH859_02515 [Hyphomicrobium aestuarii]|nr:hypothetical protein [Hyphomicrobium aestuarii]
MTAPDPQSSPDDSLETLRRLVNTALHDYSTYVNEDMYWQVPRSRADSASYDVMVHFAGRDLTTDELALLGEAIATSQDLVLVENCCSG